MPWTELSIDASEEAVDWVGSLLSREGIAVEMQVTRGNGLADAPVGKQTLAEQTTASPTPLTLHLYLPQDRGTALVNKILDLLSPLHRIGLVSEPQIDRIQQIPLLMAQDDTSIYRIGERFVVLSPTATYQVTASEIAIRLKSSLSFGSGLHPATQLCLRLLERYITPAMQVLDLGTGSGILSVAMAKLGATVLALDNDLGAVADAQEAMERNGVTQQVTVQQGSLGQGSALGHWMGGDSIEAVPILQATARFDLIVANILARVHIALADDFRQALRSFQPQQPGILITGGFTVDQEDSVNAALTAAGFVAIDAERQEEWVVLAHQLNS